MDELTREKIRERAYQIFESRSRNGLASDPVSDWLQAEREIVNGQASLVGEQEATRGRRPSRKPNKAHAAVSA
jgi:hypothetical protein